jgi:hypothetical protein
MKKLIITLLMVGFTGNAVAGDWVLPLVGGVVLGSVLSKPQNPYIAPQIYGPGGYATLPPRTVYHTPPANFFQQTYNCLVPVRDPLTGYVRNEVMTCVQ